MSLNGLKMRSVALEKSLEGRHALTEQYLPYVRSIARKIKKTLARNVDFNDLVEYGLIGLLEAADRYNESYGANFMTFAYYRIRGAIYDGLRSMGWVNRSDYARQRFEERANEYLQEMVVDCQATDHTKKDFFEKAIYDLAAAVQGLAAIYITTSDNLDALPQLPDEKTSHLEEELGFAEIKDLVRQSIEKLPAQERELLELYYYQDLNLQEVGERLGLSKSWTSRLHARIINKLYHMLESCLL